MPSPRGEGEAFEGHGVSRGAQGSWTEAMYRMEGRDWQGPAPPPPTAAPLSPAHGGAGLREAGGLLTPFRPLHPSGAWGRESGHGHQQLWGHFVF